MGQYNRISKIIIAFNIFTLVLYMFPPVISLNTNRSFVIAYLVISIILMRLGLKAGYKKACFSKLSESNRTLSRQSLTYYLLFYICTFLIHYGYVMGYSPLNIGGMVNQLLIGLYNPDLGYELARNAAISPVPWSVHYLLCIVIQLFFVIMFCCWGQLGKVHKILVVILAVIDLFYWVGTGTAFGVITMITTFFFTYTLSQKDSTGFNLANVKSKLKFYILGALGLIGALVFFSYNIIGRTGGGDSSKSLSIILQGHAINYNNFIVKNLPDEYLSAYYFIYSYVCQGYEALGCAMDCEFHWTRMVGNNPNLMSLAHFLTGYKALDDSYMIAIDKQFGIDYYKAWHSQYLWWANDFTIPGTLIIVFIIAYFCGYALNLATNKNDFMSKIVCIVHCNLLLFMFANNTYLTSIFYSYMLFFPYWYYKKYNL